ncbi:Histidine kinase-, DNA gyrase B-, and HSP90-like ATPase [Natronincola peptidivorans]|uniref:Histidine kinase-, DNA gyrase B-, and HSP90-like ATPase n=1 Tax=Natronincola peptidivorans TaxID=426128 RepID=A0A1I0D7Q1_9FIRM|nr:histidine kinase [Natronincola peptidivorans]SET27659.1 Histidine kinase-, DNA gyrase B-, and HSP90-like ATPase [Natronincola peptidivorans]
MDKGIFRFTGIRKKLIIYFLITTLILGITSVFSYYNARIVLTGLKTIITDYIYLNDLNNDVQLLMTEVEQYLTTKSSDALLNYYTIYNSLEEKIEDINRDPSYDTDDLKLKNIRNMVDNLLIETDYAVRAKRGRISSEYIAHFTRSIEISDHIKFYINNLLDNKLQHGSDKYDNITKNMTFISYMNAILILFSIMLNIFLAILFTYRLTKPIIELADSAEEISEGNFDIQPISIKTNDEIHVLAGAFNKMVVSIKIYIDEIKKQAEVETRLKQQEMENFRMKSLLKDAELKSLQSQINPHFLFNTLNAATQLAMMEGADQSSEFIERIAGLFRYNLRKMDEPVTLAEEINYVKDYMYILKIRFGDKIEFFTDIDNNLLEVKVPCTIIQPIVENAFIHGLENLERKGRIYLNLKADQDKILVEVIDNGIGMEKEKVFALILTEDEKRTANKHATGIGMHNVIDRLRLFYNIDDIREIIEIDSRVGNGTKVVLKIPYEGKVLENGETVNC